MLKLCLIAYLSGGAFLSLAYFDLPWHIVAIAYLLKHQVLTSPQASAPEAPRQDHFSQLPDSRPPPGPLAPPTTGRPGVG
jgi:hypothetical protein